jgi:hypothetical protein
MEVPEIGPTTTPKEAAGTDSADGGTFSFQVLYVFLVMEIG